MSLIVSGTAVIINQSCPDFENKAKKLFLYYEMVTVSETQDQVYIPYNRAGGEKQDGRFAYMIRILAVLPPASAYVNSLCLCVQISSPV